MNAQPLDNRSRESMLPASDPLTRLERLRVASVQPPIEDGKPWVNVSRVEQAIRAAAPADLVLLPELWTTGYDHRCWHRVAREDTPRVAESQAALAAELDCWLGGSMVSLREDGRLVNRFWLFAPDGREPRTYDKGHLFAPMLEDQFLAPGEHRVKVGVGPWTAALSICFDLRFPEMYRLDAADGADLYLVVSAWPATRAALLRLLAQARAAENQAYLVLCNRLGTGSDGTAFGGQSMIVGPEGRIVASAERTRESAVATLELVKVREARNSLPVLSLRRPQLDWRTDASTSNEGCSA